jgi:surfeit locus 1 family protein
MSVSSRVNRHFDRYFWLITLSAMLMIGLTFSLGLWQIDRAAQKEKLSESRSSAQTTKLSGQWDAAKTVYLDNRQMTIGGQTRQGFFVITPLATSASEFVLVQRGWIARDFVERKRLAPIDTPSGQVTIEVRKLPDPMPLAVFAKGAADDFPIVASIDLETARKALSDKAYKGMVQQVGNASEGLLRNWFEPASGADKNYGYAFQWFAMSAVLVGLYLWFQWLKPMLKT